MHTRQHLARIIFAVLLSGAMWFLSAGIYHVWLLAWFAPCPLLALLPDLRVGRAALAAWAASTLGALSFVVAYDSFPPLLRASMILLFAVPFTTVALVWCALIRRVPPLVSVVAYPALATSVEYLTSLVSPNGTFGSLAYSQADVPLVLQLASVTGLWGLSFLVSLVAAALVVAWRHREERRLAFGALAVGFAPLLLTLAFGAFRLATPPPSGSVRVGLAVSDAGVETNFLTRDAASGLAVVRAYAGRAALLAKQGAQIVVLPEKFVGVTPEYADEARTLLRDAARNNHVTIVAGFNFIGPSERRNMAVVFGPDGSLLLEYDKQHLVPGFEGKYRRGQDLGLVPLASIATGVAICKDLDFVPLGRDYARAGVGLLLVPAWDFVNDGWLHSRMAVMRGVEGGYAVARSASEGLLTVSDARGRIGAERASNAAPDVLLVAEVPIGSGGTFYSRTGDWFAWLCVGAAIACLVAARRKRALPAGPERTQNPHVDSVLP